MTENNSRFKVTAFNTIEKEVISWLWEPYLPLGAISIITGDPGVGKSFQSIYLASIISVGGKFPSTDNNIEEGNVIIQNGEDSKGGTIKQRLIDSGANENRVFIIEPNEDNDKGDLLLKDIDELEQIFEELKPKMIVFDPITSFLDGDSDMNNATKSRSATKPIAKLAQKYNCAVIFIIHRNKSNGAGNSLHRVLGSVDWGAIARSVISIGKNPNADEVLFMHTKCNVAQKGKTLAFNIVNGVINWLGERDYLEDETVFENKNKLNKKDEAKEFILDYLEENLNCEFKLMLDSAKGLGITEKTLIRARDELMNERVIDKKSIGSNSYVWYLKSNGQIPSLN